MATRARTAQRSWPASSTTQVSQRPDEPAAPRPARYGWKPAASAAAWPRVAQPSSARCRAGRRSPCGSASRLAARSKSPRTACVTASTPSSNTVSPRDLAEGEGSGGHRRGHARRSRCHRPGRRPARHHQRPRCWAPHREQPRSRASGWRRRTARRRLPRQRQRPHPTSGQDNVKPTPCDAAVRVGASQRLHVEPGGSVAWAAQRPQ